LGYFNNQQGVKTQCNKERVFWCKGESMAATGANS
jgi:hypothetical protein